MAKLSDRNTFEAGCRSASRGVNNFSRLSSFERSIGDVLLSGWEGVLLGGSAQRWRGPETVLVGLTVGSESCVSRPLAGTRRTSSPHDARSVIGAVELFDEVLQ